MIAEQASVILRRTIDADRPFVEYGLDSLGMLEMRTHIETETGIRLSPKVIATTQHRARLGPAPADDAGRGGGRTGGIMRAGLCCTTRLFVGSGVSCALTLQVTP